MPLPPKDHFLNLGVLALELTLCSTTQIMKVNEWHSETPREDFGRSYQELVPSVLEQAPTSNVSKSLTRIRSIASGFDYRNSAASPEATITTPRSGQQ